MVEWGEVEVVLGVVECFVVVVVEEVRVEDAVVVVQEDVGVVLEVDVEVFVEECFLVGCLFFGYLWVNLLLLGLVGCVSGPMLGWLMMCSMLQYG